MTEVVLSQGIAEEHFPDAELAEIVRLAGAENLTAWIEHLREAETSIRRHRKRLEALRDSATARVCPGCGGPVTGRADAVYCGSTCRVRAHRARSQPHDGTTARIVAEAVRVVRESGLPNRTDAMSTDIVCLTHY